MKPIHFEGANTVLTKPDGMTDAECGSLHVHTDGRVCQSVWELTEVEACDIGRSRLIRVWVHSGQTQPPIALGVVEPELNSPDSPEVAKYKVKADCYGTKLQMLCGAIRRRGVEVAHVGIGQGWAEECERALNAIEGRKGSQWAFSAITATLNLIGVVALIALVATAAAEGEWRTAGALVECFAASAVVICAADYAVRRIWRRFRRSHAQGGLK